jgi:hypothetical protein
VGIRRAGDATGGAAGVAEEIPVLVAVLMATSPTGKALFRRNLAKTSGQPPTRHWGKLA